MEQALRLDVVGERTDQRRDEGVAPVVVQLDRLDVDLEHLAPLRAFHRHRPGADMTGQRRTAEALVDGRQPGRNPPVGGRQDIRASRDGGDGDPVPRLDRQAGGQCGIEVTPVGSVGAGVETMGHGL